MDDNYQPAYLIHQRPYRETSAFGEFITLNSGRVSLLMPGLRKRPGHGLQYFMPIQLQWTERRANRILTDWERVGVGAKEQLSGHGLYCGYYLNELLVRLLPVGESCPELFVFYNHALIELAEATTFEPALRLFEKKLLESLGFYFDCQIVTASQTPVEDAQWYQMDIERGEVWDVPEGEGGPGYVGCFSGRALQAFASESFESDPKGVKALARYWLNHYLGRRPLQSRVLFSASSV